MAIYLFVVLYHMLNVLFHSDLGLAVQRERVTGWALLCMFLLYNTRQAKYVSFNALKIEFAKSFLYSSLLLRTLQDRFFE